MDVNRTPLAPWIWLVYLVLFTVAVPWYWSADYGKTVLGFPVWAVVSVGGSAAISCFTAWLFLNRWPATGNDETTERDDS